MHTYLASTNGNRLGYCEGVDEQRALDDLARRAGYPSWSAHPLRDGDVELQIADRSHIVAEDLTREFERLGIGSEEYHFESRGRTCVILKMGGQQTAQSTNDTLNKARFIGDGGGMRALLDAIYD